MNLITSSGLDVPLAAGCDIWNDFTGSLCRAGAPSGDPRDAAPWNLGGSWEIVEEEVSKSLL